MFVKVHPDQQVLFDHKYYGHGHPRDTFECEDEVGEPLVQMGVADKVDAPEGKKPAATGGKK